MEKKGKEVDKLPIMQLYCDVYYVWTISREEEEEEEECLEQ